MSSLGLAFCLSEDRADCETGLRLAILSLSKHCPGTPVYVYRPEITGRFSSWVAQFPQVTLIPSRPGNATSWNCKPHALLPLLAAGHSDVVWLDSDIIVTRDFRSEFTGLPENVVAVAQEPASLPHQGTSHRTTGWNLRIGREIPFTLNSCVLRFTKRHIPFLERWLECLGDAIYLKAQTQPLAERPLHLMGDQDILCALLGADEFAGIPLKILRTGVDVIHAGGGLGYSSLERLRGLFKAKPTFLHATAGKPWLWLGGDPYWSQQNFFSWHRRLLQETSPYLHEARMHKDQLGEGVAWMYKRTVTGSVLGLMGFGHFALRGLPITMLAAILSGISKH